MFPNKIDIIKPYNSMSMLDINYRYDNTRNVNKTINEINTLAIQPPPTTIKKKRAYSKIAPYDKSGPYKKKFFLSTKQMQFSEERGLEHSFSSYINKSPIPSFDVSSKTKNDLSSLNIDFGCDEEFPDLATYLGITDTIDSDEQLSSQFNIGGNVYSDASYPLRMKNKSLTMDEPTFCYEKKLPNYLNFTYTKEKSEYTNLSQNSYDWSKWGQNDIPLDCLFPQNNNISYDKKPYMIRQYSTKEKGCGGYTYVFRG